MEDNRALKNALEVAQRQLVEAERELREARDRVRNLRSVVYGLKQLFEPGGGAESEDERAFISRASRLRHHAALTDSRADLPTEGGVRRRDDGNASSVAVERAVQLLAEAGRPMQMREICAEWEERGWVNQTWKAPKSAINMVYQRALKAGLVGRMSDRSWVLPVAVQEQLAPADEPDGGERGEGTL
ncbi:hypothetical protein ACFWBX_20665 [Streptomyces sp. NPDC059991]|uniref:hypothetical protein n=1 Tax=Streptomyces sp. NPDC059991 TaxID=3347028 RepID=UPI0036B2B947